MSARFGPNVGRSLPSCWQLSAKRPPTTDVSLAAVGGEMSEGLALARVRLACGQMVGGADAIVEAYRFGVPEGPHCQPWTFEYHREAVHVYNESLPRSYQRDVARLFRDCERAMAGRLIPARLAEDWVIVTAYMREAAGAIEDWLASSRPASHRSEPETAPELTAANPTVIHWDALAALATCDGTRRLKRASAAVRQHFDAEAPPSLAAFRAVDVEEARVWGADRGRGQRVGLLGALDVPGAVQALGQSSECRAGPPDCRRRPPRA